MGNLVDVETPPTPVFSVIYDFDDNTGLVKRIEAKNAHEAIFAFGVWVSATFGDARCVKMVSVQRHVPEASGSFNPNAGLKLMLEDASIVLGILGFQDNSNVVNSCQLVGLRRHAWQLSRDLLRLHDHIIHYEEFPAVWSGVSDDRD